MLVTAWSLGVGLLVVADVSEPDRYFFHGQGLVGVVSGPVSHACHKLLGEEAASVWWLGGAC